MLAPPPCAGTAPNPFDPAPIRCLNSTPTSTCSFSAGPPDFTAGWWLPLFNVSRQMVLAVLICMVDICESISIAKALARVNK